MSTHTSRFQRIKMIVHVVVWTLVFTSMGAWLTVYMVGTLGDPLKKTDRAKLKVTATPLEIDVFETDKTKNRRLGDEQFSEPVLPGHFHHIGKSYESDRFNFCIDCHGWLPHSRSKEMRSFLNMHTVFTDCMVCHVLTEDDKLPDQFVWRRLTDGTIGESISMSTKSWGEYGYKIMPVTRNGNAEPQPWRLTDEEALATKLQDRREPLDSVKKTVSNKLIHRRCADKPLRCKQCHTTDNSVLPFAMLGYDEKRRLFLSSIEVVEILEEKKVFYLPKLLEPYSRDRAKDVKRPPAAPPPVDAKKTSTKGDAAHE